MKFDHKKKGDAVTVDHEKNSDGLRNHHKKEQWGETSQ